MSTTASFDKHQKQKMEMEANEECQDHKGPRRKTCRVITCIEDH